MKHGFDTDRSPVPDHLLLGVPVREWRRRVFEKPTNAYLSWKQDHLQRRIAEAVRGGLIKMSYDDGLKLTYRIKALSVVTKTLDDIYNLKE